MAGYSSAPALTELENVRCHGCCPVGSRTMPERSYTPRTGHPPTSFRDDSLPSIPSIATASVVTGSQYWSWPVSAHRVREQQYQINKSDLLAIRIRSEMYCGTFPGTWCMLSADCKFSLAAGFVLLSIPFGEIPSSSTCTAHHSPRMLFCLGSSTSLAFQVFTKSTILSTNQKHKNA